MCMGDSTNPNMCTDVGVAGTTCTKQTNTVSLQYFKVSGSACPFDAATPGSSALQCGDPLSTGNPVPQQVCTGGQSPQ
jgi:hypothetical protein